VLDRELRQFGAITTTRAGLTRLDLRELEPYEQAAAFREAQRSAERLQDVKLALARACFRQSCPAALALNATLARTVVNDLSAELKNAAGGASPPPRNWQAIIAAIQSLDENKFSLVLATLAQPPYAQPASEAKWSDGAAPGSPISAASPPH
jgi:hypothetical protein